MDGFYQISQFQRSPHFKNASRAWLASVVAASFAHGTAHSRHLPSTLLSAIPAFTAEPKKDRT